MYFVGGTIQDIVALSQKSEKYFPVVLWTNKEIKIPEDFLEKAGITAAVDKTQPFDNILKTVQEILSKK
jgi:hypothetical protein